MNDNNNNDNNNDDLNYFNYNYDVVYIVLYDDIIDDI